MQNIDRFKFRLWNKPLKYEESDHLENKYRKMLYGIEHSHDSYGSHRYDSGNTDYDIADFGYVISYKVEKQGRILMQCTALKDKNGKLIYEGDILAYDKKYFVRWKAPLMKAVFDIHDKFCHGSEYLSHIYWEESTIIGNIYENPELINQ